MPQAQMPIPKTISRVLCLFLVVGLINTGAAFAATQATYYAAPAGGGPACSLQFPGSLTGVRDKVRTVNANMTGDIIVYLRGGTYALTSTFQLTESAVTHDSGTNGFNIIYKAFPGETPTISGGQAVTGWTLYDTPKNIYRAYVGTSLQTRQLYVNGVRAIRARSALNPAGFTKTATGWTTPDAAMQNWGNPTDIEFVSRSSWKHLRCGVASIAGTAVTMKTPCWNNAGTSPNLGIPWNGAGLQQMNTVAWVENAYELLDSEREWYVDRSAGYLYYKPGAGEELSTASVVVPVVEKLVDVSGTSPALKIHNIQFNGITFAYATWLQPNGGDGYADNQAGILWTGSTPAAAKTLGNFSCQYASNIRLDRNKFMHLGGAAIDFGHGAQGCVIAGNTITDISSNGIQLGEVTDYAASDPNIMTDGNTIKDNYIRQLGREYEDAVGIWAGYCRNTTFDHNEIGDGPYSGMSVGWGWGAASYMANNTISNNSIDHTMQVLNDGGGIYTLSAQGTASQSSTWFGNSINSSAIGLYTDEGSAYMDLHDNVVLNVWNLWLQIWTPTIHDIAVHGNFTNSASVLNNGTNCTVTNTVLVDPNNLPAAAQAIINNAGLEASYQDLRPSDPLVNDTSPGIVYTGTWNAGMNRGYGDYLDDVHYASGTNTNAFAYTFTGSGIDYITEKYLDEGTVDIYIDGVFRTTVDCTNPTRLSQQTVYSVTGLPYGAHTLRAVGNTGQYFLLDALRVHAAAPVIVPAVPTGLTAVPDAGQVTLSWLAAARAVSYSVQRASTSGGPYAQVVTPIETTYTDTGLTNGATYYYVVAAVNTGGVSANSLQVSATPAVPYSGNLITDFNGDGKPDLVLQNKAAAQAALWYLSGPTVTGGGYLTPNPAAGWSICGAGDFNGDGKPDLVLQNAATNQIRIWHLNGPTILSDSAVAATPAMGWSVVAVGDFNGDHKADLVLQNAATNQVAFWYLSDTALLGGAYASAVPPAGWKVVGSADMNGDGKSDLILQNTVTNAVALWYMNGAALISGAYVSAIPAAGWRVVGAGDYNGDSKPDLILQNTVTNRVALWYLNGPTVIGGAYVSATPPVNWLVAGPR